MPMVAQPMTVSGLAAITGKSRRHVAKALSELVPVGKKGNATLYPSAEALEAIYLGGKPGDNLARESARLKCAQANKAERELQIMEGDLITGEQVKDAWGDMVTAFRAKMLALPSKISVRAVGLTPREMEIEAREIVYEALQGLSDEYGPDGKYQRSQADSSRSNDPGCTTAAADG